ncbi:DUF6735 family protein [Halobellus ordinarius]|uniref:DUF6735 family protein n=1 Tax=Halobellus ordinarius TaxID=3075120 RepID=UPI00288066A6|nr:DUF6735 family protein [Halobellus sp. ZY16]
MSQSALIAFENSDGTFDLYWSHNGADEFYLKPYLEDVVSGERSRTLPDVEPKLPDGAEDQRFRVVDSLKKAVVPQPVSQRVPRRKVGENIDFLAYEGFYLVSNQGVQLYYPMWTYPGIFIALREMFDLEVYDRNRFENASETELEEAVPEAIISSDGYSLDKFENIRYRRFFELHHLGIFQTISGTVNTATKESDLQSNTLVKEEYVNIIPKTIENLFEPHRVGNGVLISFPWDEGNVSQRLNSIINRASSIRVDVSLRLLKESGGTPTQDQYEQFERELVEQAYRHFGMMIYDEGTQPFTSLLQEISEAYAPNKRVRGERYRVIDTDGESALLKPTEQYGKTGVVNQSALSSDDVQIVDLEQTAEEFIGVATHIEDGDIVIADLDDSTTPSRIQSIQLLQKIPMVMADVEVVPEFVEQLYEDQVKGSTHSDKFPSVRTFLTSVHETISDSKIDIGEVQVTHDPENIIWKGLEFGEISEQVYGRFQFTSEQPHEVILCNPQTEPYWFGFLFESPMTGFARYWRNQFGCEYQVDTLNPTGKDTDIAEEVMSELGETFDLLMSAKNGVLSPEPRTIETTFTGSKSEAIDSARTLVEEVANEAPVEVYEEYISEVDPIPGSDESRHQVNIVIDGPSDTDN